MLKNKSLLATLAMSLVTGNAVTTITNNNQLTKNNSIVIKTTTISEISKTVSNTKYGSLSNGSILAIQDENELYHLFDIKKIVDNSKLKPYAQFIYIDNSNYRLTYNSDKVSKDVIEEFDKEVAAANYNEEHLTSTNDLQIFQKQNLSKISTTAYKSNKESDKKFTFLQFGGANTTHIVLTGTKGIVDNIKDYDDLSESLAIYNIAKSHPRNSSGICSEFVDQLINKSSLRNDKTIDNNIYENILNDFIDSSNLETFVNGSPLKNNIKDMSIRYLLDNTGNVISVGYLQYDSHDLDTYNDFILNHSFPKDGAVATEYDSEITTLLKWSDYADSWENFTFLYPTIFANSTDSITYNVMNNYSTVKGDELNLAFLVIYVIKF